MNDQEILIRAYRKAMENDPELEVLGIYNDNGDIVPEILIFNHDFAKALWPKEDNLLEHRNRGIWYEWQYHLQMMVISDDPIKYLGDNL